MSTPWLVLALGWIFLLGFTVALVLTRASREREIRRQVAADIRERARQVQRFAPDGQFTHGLLTAAAIAEHERVGSGFVTVDSSRRARPAGDYRRSS